MRFMLFICIVYGDEHVNKYQTTEILVDAIQHVHSLIPILKLSFCSRLINLLMGLWSTDEYIFIWFWACK